MRVLYYNFAMNGEYFIVENTLEEGFLYVSTEFPLRVFANPDEYPGSANYPWHWHNEIEITMVAEGSMEYCLPSGSCTLARGDIIFVNSNVLHMTKFRQDETFLQKGVLFSHQLVSGPSGSLINTKFVKPVLSNRTAGHMVFGRDTPQGRTIRGHLEKLFALMEELPEGYEIEARNILSAVWLIVYKELPEDNVSLNADFERMKYMMDYINKHYSEKISLKEIASAAHLSDRECNRTFRRVMDLTPFAYLGEMRIDQARELLRTTERPITEIAAAVGFSSSAYFAAVFRKSTGKTPTEYKDHFRKQEKAERE